jgi:phage shock protein PspC (stress-responsive transcriptional regulator)
VFERMADQLPIKERIGQGGLIRPRQGRVLAGVLVGIANRFGVSPNVARLLFVLSMLLPGPQILAYVALWILMPSE